MSSIKSDKNDLNFVKGKGSIINKKMKHRKKLKTF